MDRHTIEAIIAGNLERHRQVCERLAGMMPLVERAAALMIQSLKNDGRVLFCGNGGSAADAQHLAAELSGRYLLNRPALDAEALHVNTSALTAIANDFGYETVFSRQVEAHGRPGDTLVAISTSGGSANVVKAAEAARRKNMRVIAMTGERNSLLAGMADVVLAVPTAETPRIQEMHILIGHTLCEIIEKSLFEEK
ncbi:phosphoheptose isomerase [Pyramidobacter piscolens W5455]|uniref:Phosphoheptose isomerase n=1 Tax=Pyramidobacter piscolens W5455 TaxID=352165 RepID=A0ABM9ZWG3_9BACT|nr:D-sedoheptulose 7-phosphate isomerase [Pyramidobacter piscolens]EFB91223.1 phosphoheptose isomerase [Pyramidobacter piscolens W5455]